MSGPLGAGRRWRWRADHRHGRRRSRRLPTAKSVLRPVLGCAQVRDNHRQRSDAQLVHAGLRVMMRSLWADFCGRAVARYCHLVGEATAPQFFGARYARGGVRRDVAVLSSKLRPPAGRPGSVARRDLLARLNDSVSAKLVVVAAPAGWGKTSLLRDWCSALEAIRTVWLSVDQDDNDPVRFWAHVISAIASVHPGVGEAALQVLTAPGPKDAEGVLTPLINDLERLVAPVTLVLDDYHLISNPSLLECVAYLVEHLPATLRLVVSARSDPVLPLERLRARGGMT
jgi:hypothetical protein